MQSCGQQDWDDQKEKTLFRNHRKPPQAIKPGYMNHSLFSKGQLYKSTETNKFIVNHPLSIRHLLRFQIRIANCWFIGPPSS